MKRPLRAAGGPALALAVGVTAAGWTVALGDVGQGTAFFVNVENTRLVPVLTARVGSPDREYRVRVRGYFKVGRARIAKLAPFTTTASTTPRRIHIAVPRSVRHRIGVAVRDAHAYRVTLTLVVSGTATGALPASDNFSEDFFLRVR